MFEPLNNLSIDQLEAARALLNVLLAVGTFAVLIGVYFEQDGNPEDVKKWGWSLVAKGVALELFCGILLWQIDSSITTRHEREVATIYERAATAEKAAGEANERAAKAELKVAKLRNPRIIKDDQFTKMVALLRPQKGKKFWIITERNDQDLGSEQMLLSAQVVRVFLAAGWIRDSHLSIDQSVAESEFAPVSDRGCNLATAADAESLALRQLVFESLKSSDLECFQNVAPAFLPQMIVLEVGLR